MAHSPVTFWSQRLRSTFLRLRGGTSFLLAYGQNAADSCTQSQSGSVIIMTDMGYVLEVTFTVADRLSHLSVMTLHLYFGLILGIVWQADRCLRDFLFTTQFLFLMFSLRTDSFPLLLFDPTWIVTLIYGPKAVYISKELPHIFPLQNVCCSWCLYHMYKNWTCWAVTLILYTILTTVSVANGRSHFGYIDRDLHKIFVQPVSIHAIWHVHQAAWVQSHYNDRVPFIGWWWYFNE